MKMRTSFALVAISLLTASAASVSRERTSELIASTSVSEESVEMQATLLDALQRVDQGRCVNTREMIN